MQKPSERSSVFASATKRPMFGEVKKRSLATNKLSQYYEDILRNKRDERESIERYSEIMGKKDRYSSVPPMMRYLHTVENEYAPGYSQSSLIRGPIDNHSTLSQLRQQEEDDLCNDGEYDTPGPGAYGGIYQNSSFTQKPQR